MLRRAIEEVLSDAPRSGSTGTFTAEQVTQILAVACEPPELSGRPIDRWTHRELADEVVLRGIVPCISVSQVGSQADRPVAIVWLRDFGYPSTFSSRSSVPLSSLVFRIAPASAVTHN